VLSMHAVWITRTSTAWSRSGRSGAACCHLRPQTTLLLIRPSLTSSSCSPAMHDHPGYRHLSPLLSGGYGPLAGGRCCSAESPAIKHSALPLTIDDACGAALFLTMLITRSAGERRRGGHLRPGRRAGQPDLRGRRGPRHEERRGAAHRPCWAVSSPAASL